MFFAAENAAPGTMFLPSNHHKMITIYHPKTHQKAQNPLQKRAFHRQ
jgi:hypothetical protein